ncbi:MAG: amidohydrolase family protein [Planctomycetota bacterium]
MIAKTRGNTVDDAVIVPAAMIAATIGETANEEAESKAPRTRSKQVAMLRAELVRAREYRDKMAGDEGDRPDRDLRLEALARVLDRELPLLVTVQRHNDIVTALRLAEEFNLRLVLDGAAEAYLVLEEIRAAGVPVIIHPTMMRAWGEMENLALDTAASLAASGIPFALQSGFEDYVPKTRVILYEAGVSAAYGLGGRAALASITIDAARLLGIDQRVGSLEVGKDGDIALYDGDPLEYTTHCVGVVIEGSVVSEEIR